MLKFLLLTIISLLLAGCTSNVMVSTRKALPPVYKDINDTHQEKKDITVSVFRLQNFTDTPRAGMRASNIAEGILKSKGYQIISHVNEKKYSFKKAYRQAKNDDSKYFLFGGVSEWRYKTGIDGEPAVSLQMSLYKTKNKKLIWSATGSDSDWGNGSIGTTAQSMMLNMMEE